MVILGFKDLKAGLFFEDCKAGLFLNGTVRSCILSSPVQKGMALPVAVMTVFLRCSKVRSGDPV